MPTEFTIDTKRGVVISRGTGVLTHADYLAHIAQLKAHPRFCAAFNQIVDWSGFSAIDLSSEEVENLARTCIFGSRTRRAFVVSSELQHGLARMFATWREIEVAQQVMVFRDMDDAVSWLGLPPEYDPYAKDESASAHARQIGRKQRGRTVQRSEVEANCPWLTSAILSCGMVFRNGAGRP